MTRIVVFDSGLGSLSIIKPIQKFCKCEIIYFADHKNFPYGNKSKKQLELIIKNSIKFVKKKFKPDLIVMGSNTPTIMLSLTNEKIIGVNPPLREASKISTTKNIGILATETVVKSRMLSKYIQKCKLPLNVKIHKVNASALVSLVESGKFIENKKYCKQKIRKLLQKILFENNIDAVTLSSTHLPFLKTMLKSEFPDVQFLDPADNIAKKLQNKISAKQNKKNSLKIYSSGQTKNFTKTLKNLGINNKIELLSI